MSKKGPHKGHHIVVGRRIVGRHIIEGEFTKDARGRKLETPVRRDPKQLRAEVIGFIKEGYDVQLGAGFENAPILEKELTELIEREKRKFQRASAKEISQAEEVPTNDPAAIQMKETMNLLRGGNKALKDIVKECEKLYRKYQEAARSGTETKKLEAINAFYLKVKAYSDQQTKKYSKQKGTIGVISASGLRRVERGGGAFYAPPDTPSYGTERVQTNPKLAKSSLPQGVVDGVSDAKRYYEARVQMKKLAAKFKELIRQGQSPHAQEKARIASKFFERLHDDPKLYKFLQGEKNFPKKEVRKGFETEEINAEKFLEMLRQLEGNETVFLSDMGMMRSVQAEKEITNWNYSKKDLTEAPPIINELLGVAALSVKKAHEKQEAQKAVKAEQFKGPKKGVMNLFSKQRSTKPPEVTEPSSSVSKSKRKPGKK